MTGWGISKVNSLTVIILISFDGRILTATKNDVQNLTFKGYCEKVRS